MAAVHDNREIGTAAMQTLTDYKTAWASLEKAMGER